MGRIYRNLAHYPWLVVGMLWMVCFFNYADRQAISSIMPLLKNEFHFDDVQSGWILSAFAWVYAAAAPVAGIAADRFSRKGLIILACVVWSFFTLATGWCGGLVGLVLVRALTGLGETFYFPSSMSLISDYHSAATRSRAMAWHQSAVYTGTVLGSWIAAALAEKFGWRVPFYIFGPVGILLAIFLVRFLEEPDRDQPAAGVKGGAADGHGLGMGPRLSVGETVGVILRTPAALMLMCAFVCANFVAVIFLTWTPQFLVEKFHYSIGAAGLTGTVYVHLASAVTAPLAGWFADSMARRFAAGRMLVQIIGLLAGASFIFFVGHTSSTATLLVSMTVFGVCKCLYDSGIFASLYDAIPPRARGTGAGLMNTIGWAGGALGPLFVGYVTKHGTKPTRMENMSDAIGFGGYIYIVAAGFLLAAIWFHRRSLKLSRAQA